MGHFSVYCQISRITIKEGQKCVFLPLRRGGLRGAYVPTLLPIFGTYSGYGDLEDVEITSDYEQLCNTHFNCSVEDLVDKILHTSELKTVFGCFIDRKVWDFLTKEIINKEEKHLPDIASFNHKDKIEYYFDLFLNFGSLREENLPEKYRVKRKVSKREDIDFDAVFKHFKECAQKEKERIASLPEEEQKAIEADRLRTKLKIDTSIIYNNTFLFPYDHSDYVKQWEIEHLERHHKDSTPKKIREIKAGFKDRINNINDQVTCFMEDLVKNYEDHLNFLNSIVNLRYNLWSFASNLEPYNPDVHRSPQDGRFDEHSYVLSKFLEINDSYIQIEEC